MPFPPHLTIVLATNNAHKIREIKHILSRAQLKIRLLSLKEFPHIPPVKENQRTIEGNAIKKAKSIARQTGCWALADDTGLFIQALKGKPGVYSARFAGPACDYAANNKKVLARMANVPPRKRQALFRTIAALANPRGRVFLVEGRVAGRIAATMRGQNGFGYDPIFYIPRFKKTFAEMSLREKNSISHRGRAFQKVPALVRNALRTRPVRPSKLIYPSFKFHSFTKNNH